MDVKLQHTHIEPDTFVAAFLLANHHKLLGLQSGGGNRLDFRFEDPDGSVARDASTFYAGALVEAETFADCLRRVKSILYSQKFGPERERSERIQAK